MQVNTERLQCWVDEFDKAPQSNSMSMQPDKYQLDTFFWNAAQEGSAIFEMPHQYVNGISAFTSVLNIFAASCCPVTRLKHRKLRKNCAI